jgi:hypothetical protein
MRKALGLVLAGLGAVTLTGAAVAASRDNHTLNVPLPDGSVAHVNYVGSVAPKVTVSPAPLATAWSQFPMFDRSAFDVERQIDAMMREIHAIARSPIAGAPGFNVAAYGDAPAGSSSVTIVTTSNGSKMCTRRTDVTSEGPGKPPKVVSSLSGECGAAPTVPTPRANPT